MNVPLLDLKAQYASIREEVRDAIDRVVESQQFILGAEVEALEREIAEYCRCRFAIGVSSGTDALLASLMALDVGPGDEVITTPYTFFSTAGVVVRLGANPVFVDIDAATFNIDASGIESRITPRTRAIVPVHLFGQMADMNSIREIGKRRGVAVIEDAAQAIGAERDGLRAGSAGDMACFSFFPSKNLGGFGDGGMVTTNDPKLAERISMLRNHGFRKKYENVVLGGNFRLDAIQAAIIRVKLRHLDGWTRMRQENGALYRKLLAGSPVGLPQEVPNSRHVYNQFVIRSANRDTLAAHLKERGIGCEVYYPLALHLEPCFKDLGGKAGDFPESERASHETLAIPIYPELGNAAIETVAQAIRGL